MVSVGLAISALFLLGTVFMMASAQEPLADAEKPPNAETELPGKPPEVSGAEANIPVEKPCKPPVGLNQMSVSQKCQDEFFDCLKKEHHFCVWQ